MAAGGSRLRDFAPQTLWRDRADGRHARPPTRGGARRGHRSRALPARGGRDRGGGDRASEEPVEHLREDGRTGEGIRRDPRSGGDPRDRGRGEGLLGGARDGARPLATGAGPLQGLHQLAEVQPLPVPAHHGRRPPREAPRDPDQDPRDAPAGRVRDRRPLGLQGGGRRQVRRPRQAGSPAGSALDRRDRLAAADRRLGTRDPRPGGVPGDAQGRPRAGRGLRLHPQRPDRHVARGSDPGRLRLRHPHRGRAPLRGRAGQWAPAAARLEAAFGRHGRDRHLQDSFGRPLA